MEELLNAAGMASLLKVTPLVVTQWALKGVIPSIRINRRVVRFRASEVLESLQRFNSRSGVHETTPNQG